MNCRTDVHNPGKCDLNVVFGVKYKDVHFDEK